MSWFDLRGNDVNAPMNVIDLSSEAALELEELRQGVRGDVPALENLFAFLRTPAPAFVGESVSMLADVRSYVLFRDLGQVLYLGSLGHLMNSGC